MVLSPQKCVVAPESTRRFPQPMHESLRAHLLGQPVPSPRGRRAGFAPPASGHAEAPVLVQLLAPVGCPHCGSTRTVLESAFGPTQCRSIHHTSASVNSFFQVSTESALIPLNPLWKDELPCHWRPPRVGLNNSGRQSMPINRQTRSRPCWGARTKSSYRSTR